MFTVTKRVLCYIALDHFFFIIFLTLLTQTQYVYFIYRQYIKETILYFLRYKECRDSKILTYLINHIYYNI